MLKLNSFLPISIYKLFVVLVFAFTACTGARESTIEFDGDEIVETSEVSISRQVQSQRTIIDAVKARMLEDYEEALRLYRQAVRLDPNNDAARFELARIFYAMEMMEDSENQIKEAIKISPNNKWYVIFYAELKAVLREYSAAAKLYERAIELDENFIEVYFDLAFMYTQLKEYEKAIEVYNEIESRTGFDEEIALQKRQIYIRLGQFEKAAEELENLIKQFPNDIRYYGLLAELYEANDMYHMAIKVYQRLLENKPNNPYAILSMANAFLQLEDRENYIKYLKKGFENPDLEIDPKVGVLVTYIESMQDSIKKNEALELAEITKKVHPEEAKAYAVYADLLYQADMVDEALEMYIKTLDYDKSVFMVWQQILFILSDKQNFDSLKYYSAEAIEYFPNQAISYFFNGIAKIQLDEYEAAASILEEGAMIAYGNPQLQSQMYGSLGDVYSTLEEYSKSDIAYERSLELNPENAFVLNNYSYNLSIRNKDLERAEKMSRRSNELIENNEAFLDTYAWIMYKKGNYKEAKKWIEKALEHGGDESAVILDHYGDILYKLGELELAVKYWQKAKNLGLESDIIGKKIEDRTLYEE
ncbi:MAG: tetratricopeptide repeat protein [Chitinophagaceae bacterium]|nr:MAG: tetratricopeptide repeat protein [Chitinophagaceae bacterium]